MVSTQTLQSATPCCCGSPTAGTGCSCTHINMVSTQTLQSATPCHCGSPTAGTGCFCAHINVKSAHRHYSQRHLAVVVPRQQVRAAPVPTSTSSQHTDMPSPTSNCCGSPIAGTSCSCTHINIKSAHGHSVYPVLAAPVPTSTWSAHSHQHTVIVDPRQQVLAASVWTLLSSRVMNTTVT